MAVYYERRKNTWLQVWGLVEFLLQQVMHKIYVLKRWEYNYNRKQLYRQSFFCNSLDSQVS